MTHKHTYSIPSADDQNDARCIECGQLQPTTHTAKHTPGPWTVDDTTEDDDDTLLTICAPLSEVKIATMNAYENGCESFSEIRANAALIAAAPAMYEALRQAYAYLAEMGCDCEEEQSCGDCIVCQCEAALAQVDGKQ